MPSGKCKRTGAKGKKTKLHKQGVRKRFSARHIDQARGRGVGAGTTHAAAPRAQRPPPPPSPPQQVWEDVRTEAGVHDGKVGPVGTTTRCGGVAAGDAALGRRARSAAARHPRTHQCAPSILHMRRAELDDDLPAHGRHYCTTCARYFVSAEVQAGHERSKPHKRRVRELLGARPHNQVDADWAGGLGAPDNGARLRSDGEGGAAAMAE